MKNRLIMQKLPGHISMVIRSTVFAIIVPVFTAFWSLICVAAFPLPLRIRNEVVMVWTRSVVWLLKIICHIDYKVEGWDNIPRDRNGIIMSKHQSAWETFFLPSHFKETAIILKKELYWVPFFGWGMAVTDPIAIDRSAKGSAMSQIIKKGKQCLDAGRWVLIFPEGTRIKPGEIGKYRLGGARLAVEGGYPIVPVAHNAGRFLFRRKFIKRPGTIIVVFGPVIESKGKTAEEVLEVTKNWIEETMQVIDAPFQSRSNV
jgi:1-acyl-sn-glycerol-3-phosphate acyltransferase